MGRRITLFGGEGELQPLTSVITVGDYYLERILGCARVINTGVPDHCFAGRHQTISTSALKMEEQVRSPILLKRSSSGWIKRATFVGMAE
jgi:hypothetical protein